MLSQSIDKSWHEIAPLESEKPLIHWWTNLRVYYHWMITLNHHNQQCIKLLSFLSGNLSQLLNVPSSTPSLINVPCSFCRTHCLLWLSQGCQFNRKKVFWQDQATLVEPATIGWTCMCAEEVTLMHMDNYSNWSGYNTHTLCTSYCDPIHFTVPFFFQQKKRNSLMLVAFEVNVGRPSPCPHPLM